LLSKISIVVYSWVRKRILRFNPSSYKSLRGHNGPIVIDVNSNSINAVDVLRDSIVGETLH
jgi:hypothetical protein